MVKTQLSLEATRLIVQYCRAKALDPVSGEIKLDEYLKCVDEEMRKALQSG